MESSGKRSGLKKVRLHHLLFLGFTLISTIPVFFLAAWTQKSAIENEYTAIEDKHLLLAKNLTGTLDRFAKDAEQIFRVSAHYLQTNKPTEQIATLMKIVRFNHLHITDKTGRIFSIESDWQGQAPIKNNTQISHKLLSKLSLDIEQAKLLPDHVFFSPALHNSHGKPTIYLIKFTPDGSLVIGALETDYIVDMGQNISFGKLGHATIVDHKGHVLSHPNSTWRNEIKDISHIKPVSLMMAAQTGVTTFYSPAIETDMIAGFTFLPKIGWGVMIPQPLSELEERASGVRTAVIIITLFGILIAALISWWLARYLSMPMQAVVYAAGDVAKGKLNARIPTFRAFILKEANDLVLSFNSMVNELEKVERRLRTSEERFKEFASTASDWLWETDEKGRIVWESASKKQGYRGRKFIEIQGMTRQELAGDVMKKKDWAAYQKALDKHEEIKDFHYKYPGENGQIYHALINGIPLYDDEGNYKGHRGSASDITKRTKAEHELKKARDEAETANKSKSDFLANMSHDLRTPLTAIIGFSDIMRHKTFGKLGHPKYDEYVRDIHNSGTLLIGLINDILDLSKIEAGKYELTNEPLQIDELIGLSFRQLELMAESSHQSLKMKISSTLPHLKGDKRAIIQILNNLISNAIKYSPKKGTIAVNATTNENNGIEISVEDSGIGMSEQDLECATDAFEQTDRLHPRKHEGTGLGLFLCHSFMKLLGGKLKIESKVNVGTKVTLIFPASRTIMTQQEKSP
ncbi:ATP-binding protein [uncultured Kiloniella sp.]|uniref:ATP-binding protein n=1 Tax=uncultured Kiloniella sp. TaxID=1133091 RepID=UPI00260EA39B|nr:ATP-binding protein [uncultured Kiloniella sp.]